MKKIVEPKEPTITLFPYPVYLIGCECGDKRNIMVAGWVSPVCNQPPLFGVSLRPSRLSYDLIKKSKNFSLNIPSRKILEEVDFCGSFSGRDINKIEKTGLTFEYSSKKSPPIISQCPINIELTLKNIINYGNHKHLVGAVDKIFMDDDFKKDDLKHLFVAIGTDYYGLDGIIGSCQSIYQKKIKI